MQLIDFTDSFEQTNSIDLIQPTMPWHTWDCTLSM